MKTALITGTTSGIGKSFARKFASEGYDLILAARNEEKLLQQQKELQSQYGITVKYVVCDLIQENAADLIMREIERWKISVDILVNNAGFNECGLFTNTDINREMDMIKLHIQFVTKLTKYMLPSMKKNNYGRILNVGSTGSYIASPADAVYSATKAYILSFSNALCGELAGTNVKVTTLCPGATRTEFASKAGIENTMLFKLAVMQPDKVVKTAYPKLMKGKRIVIPGLYNKLLIFFSKITPVSIINKLTLAMMKR